MSKDKRLAVSLFILAECMTFLFISLLQVSEFPLFLVFLLLMHSGIVLFIVSKKRFHRLNLSVASFYKIEYILLALYLPTLFYQILSYVFSYEVNEELKLTITMIVTAVGIVVSIINTVRLIAYVKKAT